MYLNRPDSFFCYKYSIFASTNKTNCLFKNGEIMKLIKNIFLILLIIGIYKGCSSGLEIFSNSVVQVSEPEVTYVVDLKNPIVRKNSANYYEVLGFYESGNDYKKTNSIGMLGKYQFDMETLKWLGYKVTRTQFLNSPKIQEEAVRKLVKKNKQILKSEITATDGKTIVLYNGQRLLITEAGLIGASHLGGAGSVQKFLRSKGKVNRSDMNGTSIQDYIIVFNDTKI
jgi:hypothetical protein